MNTYLIIRRQNVAQSTFESFVAESGEQCAHISQVNDHRSNQPVVITQERLKNCILVAAKIHQTTLERRTGVLKTLADLI